MKKISLKWQRFISLLWYAGIKQVHKCPGPNKLLKFSYKSYIKQYVAGIILNDDNSGYDYFEKFIIKFCKCIVFLIIFHFYRDFKILHRLFLFRYKKFRGRNKIS